MSLNFDIRSNPIFWEKDPKKKGHAYANDMISLLRQQWTALVDSKVAEKGMKILMADQSIEDVTKSFAENSDFRAMVQEEGVALPVFESIRNILISEFKKGSYMPEIRAEDPTAESERQADMTKLQNRRMIEGPMNALGRAVNRPPYKLGKDKFSSNVQKFDEMGLNPSSPQDLSFFRETYQRLDHEIAASEIIRTLYKYNEFDQYAEELVNDVLAKKAIAYRVYESPQSGEFKWEYLQPENVKWIRGRRRDGKDAVAIGSEVSVTVRKFQEMAAGAFDFNEPAHRTMLMNAVRMGGNGLDWISITNQGAFNSENELCATWGDIMAMPVVLGHIEWKTVDSIAKKVNKKNGIWYKIDLDEELSANSIYRKEVDEVQETYKAFYISTGMYQQYIWNYGPVYHTLTEGNNDEFSNFTYCIWKGTGKTATQISEPLIKIVNFAFYKLWWGIWESKPNVEVYDADALINLLGAIGPTMPANSPVGAGTPDVGGTNVNQLMDLISFMRQKLVRIYSRGDRNTGGDGKPHYIEPGGLDPISVAMQSIVDWAEAKIKANLGVNALREGYTPDPRDGHKLNLEAMKQSRSATYYIPDAIANLLKIACEKSLLLSQDCIALGGKGREFLERLVGKSTVLTIHSLNKVALHRYGMFVNVANTEDLRQEIKMEALVAYQKGDIQYHEYLLIKEIPDYKKAAMTLAFFKERAERMKREQEALAHQRAMELQDGKTQGRLAEIQLEGEFKLKETDLWGEWYMRAHQIPADAAIQKKQMDIDSEQGKQDARSTARIKEIEAQGSQSRQTPLPASPLTESDQSPGA